MFRRKPTFVELSPQLCAVDEDSIGFSERGHDARAVNIEEWLACARAASKMASPYEVPERLKETFWRDMRGWHHHFLLAPKLPKPGDWDFTVREDGPSEATPVWTRSNMTPKFTIPSAEAGSFGSDDVPMLSLKVAIQTSCDVKIGFCVPVVECGQLLKSFLATTLINLWAHRRWCKVYLVDFDSKDRILDWIRMRFSEVMREDLLRVYTTKDMPEFHAAVAKNTCHRMAIEDGCHILVNLDPSNIVDPGFPRDVVMRMGRRDSNDPTGCDVVDYSADDVRLNATHGRIAQFACDFEYLRGYDEHTEPEGHHDEDLLYRYYMIGRRICGSSEACSRWWDGDMDKSPYPTTSLIDWEDGWEDDDSEEEKTVIGGCEDCNAETMHNQRRLGYMIRNTPRTDSKCKNTYPYFGCPNVVRVKPKSRVTFNKSYQIYD